MDAKTVIDWKRMSKTGHLAIDLPSGLTISILQEGVFPDTGEREFEVGLWFEKAWIWNNPANIRRFKRGMSESDVEILFEQALTWKREEIIEWNGGGS